MHDYTIIGNSTSPNILTSKHLSLAGLTQTTTKIMEIVIVHVDQKNLHDAKAPTGDFSVHRRENIKGSRDAHFEHGKDSSHSTSTNTYH